MKLRLVEQDSVDFQAEGDQEVEISMHVNEERFVVRFDGSQNKKKEKVCGNWIGYRALQEETKNVIFWHDTTK